MSGGGGGKHISSPLNPEFTGHPSAAVEGGPASAPLGPMVVAAPVVAAGEDDPQPAIHEVKAKAETDKACKPEIHRLYPLSEVCDVRRQPRITCRQREQ